MVRLIAGLIFIILHFIDNVMFLNRRFDVYSPVLLLFLFSFFFFLSSLYIYIYIYIYIYLVYFLWTCRSWSVSLLWRIVSFFQCTYRIKCHSNLKSSFLLFDLQVQAGLRSLNSPRRQPSFSQTKEYGPTKDGLRFFCCRLYSHVQVRLFSTTCVSNLLRKWSKYFVNNLVSLIQQKPFFLTRVAAVFLATGWH